MAFRSYYPRTISTLMSDRGWYITRRLATFGIFSLGQASLLVHVVDIKTGRCQRRRVIVRKPLSFLHLVLGLDELV